MCVCEENVAHKARLLVSMFYKDSNETMLLELTSTTYCLYELGQAIQVPMSKFFSSVTFSRPGES